MCLETCSAYIRSQVYLFKINIQCMNSNVSCSHDPYFSYFIYCLNLMDIIEIWRQQWDIWQTDVKHHIRWYIFWERERERKRERVREYISSYNLSWSSIFQIDFNNNIVQTLTPQGIFTSRKYAKNAFIHWPR